MSGQKNDSEEKTLPPSERKLKKAREKGQVAKSRDATTAAVMVTCTLYIFIVVPDTVARIEHLLDQVSRLYDQPFATLWPQIVAAGVNIGIHAVWPLVLIIALAVVVVNIGVMRGMVFSGEPIVPKPEKINPVEGFKRLFSLRQVIEFVKSLVKMTALLAGLVIVYRIHLPELMQSSLCGASCIRATFFDLMKPLVLTALFAFIIVGVLDIFMQRWLFRRDQRMSKTEQKRETKDEMGDPTFNRARRQKRKETLTSGKTGLRNASIVIGDRDEWVVGIRYVADEAGVPFVTCKSAPERANGMIVEASRYRLPMAYDGRLAAQIADGAAPGDPAPQETFQDIANILMAAGLL
ncbi:EscU/YscU/HrcU family type III secretion system export apparatus switch protein [Salinisphaera sp.]|uniref:EscU/YscU/HrcU family type III secretion system export apparatus switch protein n=1 Tax=Salinisphaera sp. TaxID=1914330 RepID=UPI002D765ECB|nr:EscU/YscU/HrcU family type III secretion system export apparatus switch protein [Salinisphaera sp.]HET7314006.1 EscU/YscU/HrcU family type III secretion system export apparatus switch protein [Salinisphaera sp.]